MPAVIALDLECRGYRGERWPFRVQLLTHALDHLIADAKEGHRVYEFFAIRRPGDIWKYVWVGIVDVSDNVRSRCDGARAKALVNWPDGQIPFSVFDGLFWGDGWDDEPDDVPWLLWRGRATSQEFVEACLEIVRFAQSALRHSNDSLIRHEIAFLDRFKHESDYLDSPPTNLTDTDYSSPVIPGCEPGLYAKLKELVARPEVTTVSFRGEPDHQLFRILCREQQTRREEPGAVPVEICALVNAPPAVSSWGATVTFMEEGLRWGVLHVERANRFGGPLRELLSDRLPKSSRHLLLLDRDEGEITGYRRHGGTGWMLYERIVDCGRQSCTAAREPN